MKDELSLLVGKTVKYSITKNEIGEGVVVDKIQKKEKADDQILVTGYLIKGSDGKIINISYWRILEVVEQMPKGYIPGGHNRQRHNS